MARDRCPSVARPLDRADGGLARIRLPGGRIDSAGLRLVVALAQRHGSGVIEITNRANLQVRGITSGAAGALAAELEGGGLSGGEQRDLRRNILTGPLAGLDPTETADTSPLLEALAGVLDADRRLDRLSSKCGVVVDGGGRWHLGGRRDDVAVVPRLEGRGPGTRWEVRSGSMPTLVAGEADVAAAVGEALAATIGAPARRRVTCPDPTPIRGTQPLDPIRAGPVASGPLGAAAQGAPGRCWVGTMPLLGRADAATFAGIADVADRHGLGNVRLTPWRGVVIADVAAAEVGSVQRAMSGLGLVVDDTDPAAGIVACAGACGCTAGLTDTIADARRVIDMRRRRELGVIGVHISGCDKRCAQRVPAPVTLIASARGRYDVLAADAATSGGERLLATDLDRDAALTWALRDAGES